MSSESIPPRGGFESSAMLERSVQIEPEQGCHAQDPVVAREPLEVPEHRLSYAEDANEQQRQMQREDRLSRRGGRHEVSRGHHERDGERVRRDAERDGRRERAFVAREVGTHPAVALSRAARLNGFGRGGRRLGRARAPIDTRFVRIAPQRLGRRRSAFFRMLLGAGVPAFGHGAHAAMLEFDHDVHIVEPVKPVRGEHDEPALHERQHARFELVFGFDVEVSRRLVEHDDATRSIHERAGDGDALALAAGQRPAALADDRIESVGQFGDELVEPCRADGARDLLVGRVGLQKSHVVA